MEKAFIGVLNEITSTSRSIREELDKTPSERDEARMAELKLLLASLQSVISAVRDERDQEVSGMHSMGTVGQTPQQDNSPSGLMRLIQNLTDKHQQLIMRDLGHINHLCYDRANFPVLGRRQELDAFYRYCDDRAKMRSKAIQDNQRPSERTINPLCSTFAPPGTGKSYFLDLIANDSANWPKSLKDHLPVPVTFNCPTPFQQSGIDKSSISTGLAARMLFATFLDPKSDFPTFAANMPERLSVVDAFQCIRSVSNCSGVLLLLDEILMAGGVGDAILQQQRIREIVHSVCTMLSTYGEFSCLLTTLDRNPIFKSNTGSGRPITFIPLQRPVISEYACLFRKRWLDWHKRISI